VTGQAASGHGSHLGLRLNKTIALEVVPGTIVGGIPLPVLLWWQPKMMRQILEKRL